MAGRKNSDAVPAVEAAADAPFDEALSAPDTIAAAANAAAKLVGETGSAALADARQIDIGQTVTSVNQTLVGTAAEHHKTRMEARLNMDKAMKTAEEMMAFGQGNIEAFLKSGQIWAAGVQDIGKQFAASAQAQFDETVSTFKAMTAVKSLKEAVDLQSTLARASMEKAVAESGKITDASLKLAEQALAPITARMSIAVEKFGRAV